MVLRCILRQLLERLPAIPSAVAELFEKSGHQGQMPLHECERLLIDVASGLRCAYLVFDGLDESEHRKSFLQSIQNVVRSPQVRLLITSRPHIRDFMDLFQQHLELRIEAHGEDLETYIYQELDQAGIYGDADQTFVNGLVQKLTQSAEGMYVLSLKNHRICLPASRMDLLTIIPFANQVSSPSPTAAYYSQGAYYRPNGGQSSRPVSEPQRRVRRYHFPHPTASREPQPTRHGCSHVAQSHNSGINRIGAQRRLGYPQRTECGQC